MWEAVGAHEAGTMTEIEDPDRQDPDPEAARGIRARFLCLFLGLIFLAVAVFHWLQGERTGFSAVCAGLGLIFVNLSGLDREP